MATSWAPLALVPLLLVATIALPGAPAVAGLRNVLVNGGLEGAPLEANGFWLQYPAGRIAPQQGTGTPASQAVDLAAGPAAMPWYALGNVKVLPTAPIPLAVLEEFSWSYRIPEEPLRVQLPDGSEPAPIGHVRFQFWLNIDTNGDGARDYCFLHNEEATLLNSPTYGQDATLHEQDAWARRSYDGTARLYPGVGDCPGFSDYTLTHTLDALQANATFHNAKILSASIQTNPSVLLWLPNQPIYVDQVELNVPASYDAAPAPPFPPPIPNVGPVGVPDPGVGPPGPSPLPTVTPLPGDDDRDGRLDAVDNCRTVANADQANLDGDGEGDLCDLDVDGDGFTNEQEAAAGSDLRNRNSTPDDLDADGVRRASDNCPSVANADQRDVDGDLLGDACDDVADNGPTADPDADGVRNDRDNCLRVANADQADRDLDGIGDACDEGARPTWGDGNAVFVARRIPPTATTPEAPADTPGPGLVGALLLVGAMAFLRRRP